MLRQVVNAMFTFVAGFSRDGVLLHANQSTLATSNTRLQDVYGKHFSEIDALSHSAESRALVGDMLQRAAQGETVRGELTVRLPGARLAVLDAIFFPIRDQDGRVCQIGASGVEITAHKQAESALRKLNRELRMLSSCNQILMRTDSELELLRQVCEILVRDGAYRFAWIGFAEQDAARSVRLVASAGIDADYLDRIRITWDDSPTGRGPTGRAIAGRAVEICREVAADAAFEPWRAAARDYGYVCSAALPIMIGDNCIGALNVYSDQCLDFDAAEVALLTELSNDVAYGLGALRTRVEHQRSQSRARLFRHLLDRTNDLIYVIDANTGRVLDANDAVSRQLGYTRAELLRMKLTDFSMSTAEGPWLEQLARVESAGSLVVEARHRRKDGTIVPVEISLSHVQRSGVRYLVGVTRDISERRRHEQVIDHMARVLRMQSAINAAVLRIDERDELLNEACRLATQVGGYDRAVISLVEPDGRSARPRFRAGAGADFPEPETLEIGDGTEPDSSLTSRALRTGEIVVCNDLTRSEPPVAMRQRLVELGFKSVVALPLIVDGRRIGCVTLTSRDPTFVGDDELLLLQDMTASLSFALRSQQQARAFHMLASYDPLTGLAKRSLFCERLDDTLAGHREPRAKPVVAAFDVHQLSSINDTFGRHFGDLLLQGVAERLKHNIDSKNIGYLGGGTFVIAQPGPLTSAENTSSMLEAAVFGEPFSMEGREIRVSCRTGVALFPKDGRDSDALVQKAEAALKRAKDTGEQYLHYRLEMHSEVAEHLELEVKLRRAIDAEEFEVYYQPQVSIKTGRIEAVEALLRWNDPERGLVPAPQFLPVLESSGLIVPAGNWVLKRAVEDSRRWQQLGLGPLRVAVNVSALQLRRRAFVETVLAYATDWSSSDYGLDLEITETSLLEDIEGTSQKLRELRTAGIRIALDDFGTGYSSLGLLSQLPVDLLKIDRSFVAGLPDDAASVTLARSIIALASAFGLITIAEGVETQEQLELLKELKCDLSQGFLHLRPVPVREMEAVLARGRRVT